jgi:nucleoside-diphosphate-sugar epimerase
MRRYLVIANRTLCEQHLLDEVHRRRTADPGCRFHLVVPATHPSGVFTDESAHHEAEARLSEALDTLACAGVSATGEVGDANPVYAVGDVILREIGRFDEIILSTLPVGMSKWLAENVVRRLKRSTGLPVTHVIAEVASVRT